jgi:hypothetical protein
MFLPYVYKVTHKTTGNFYIGMRSANKITAEKDLGVRYFTSSKLVKHDFSNFNIEIIAYFVDQIAAFEFENSLIESHWGDPLLLNKHYQKNMSKFSMKGCKRPDLSELNKKLKTKPKEERSYVCCECSILFKKKEFCHGPKRLTPFCSRKCAAAHNGRKTSLARKGTQMPHLHGRKTWNKGLPNPTAAENGKKGAAKQSQKVTGRKAVYRSGKRTWSYPGDFDYPTTSVTEQVGTISESESFSG